MYHVFVCIVLCFLTHVNISKDLQHAQAQPLKLTQTLAQNRTCSTTTTLTHPPRGHLWKFRDIMASYVAVLCVYDTGLHSSSQYLSICCVSICPNFAFSLNSVGPSRLCGSSPWSDRLDVPPFLKQIHNRNFGFWGCLAASSLNLRHLGGGGQIH